MASELGSGWSFNQPPHIQQPEVEQPEERRRRIFEVRTVLQNGMGEPQRYFAHSAGAALDFHAPNPPSGATFEVKYLFDLHPDYFPAGRD